MPRGGGLPRGLSKPRPMDGGGVSRPGSIRIVICIIIAGLGQIQTSTRILKPMAALYYAKHVHITQTTQIPTPLFCIVQGFKSDSESVCVFESDNVIKQLY